MTLFSQLPEVTASTVGCNRPKSCIIQFTVAIFHELLNARRSRHGLCLQKFSLTPGIFPIPQSFVASFRTLLYQAEGLLEPLESSDNWIDSTGTVTTDCIASKLTLQ